MPHYTSPHASPSSFQSSRCSSNDGHRGWGSPRDHRSVPGDSSSPPISGTYPSSFQAEVEERDPRVGRSIERGYDNYTGSFPVSSPTSVNGGSRITPPANWCQSGDRRGVQNRKQQLYTEPTQRDSYPERAVFKKCQASLNQTEPFLGSRRDLSYHSTRSIYDTTESPLSITSSYRSHSLSRGYVEQEIEARASPR